MDEIDFLRKLANCEDKEQMARCIDEFNNGNGEPDNQKWIPVSERLPEPYTDVLTYREGGCNVEWIDDSEKKSWAFDGFEHGCDVTHWMPLPEPPKGE